MKASIAKASITWALLLTQALLALALFAFTPPAQAKPALIEAQASAISLNDATINSGPSGAMLEAAYFRAPQPTLGPGPVFPCRLQLHVFEKTRLARSCN